MADRPLHTFEVVSTTHFSPHIRRVVLGGGGFDTFTPAEFTDSYIKLVFVPDNVDVTTLARPLTMQSFSGLPERDQPVLRTFTVRRADPESRQLTVDFVIHGTQGVAGPWARAARPGDIVRLLGPNGAYRPDPVADWHLFAGDEAGLPAISRALEVLPADAVGMAFIEVDGPDDEISLTKPEGVELTWVHRGRRADLLGDARAGDNAPLVAAVTGARWLPGQVHAFIHGEAQAVMHNLRPYVRGERGVEAKWASISGYWCRGRTEETFRQWKKALALAESASAGG
ncbi:MAG: siderophore-interacting protein [Mycobacterium sp.]|nr:siderophore-interacting protein [Mycobacterium sp.]